MRVSVLCRLYYPPPQLAAQPSVDSRGQRLLLPDGPEEDKLAEVILKPEGETERERESNLLPLIRFYQAKEEQTRSDIWWRNCLKYLRLPACDSRLLDLQSHLLKSSSSFWWFSCLCRQKHQEISRGDETPKYSQTDESARLKPCRVILTFLYTLAQIVCFSPPPSSCVQMGVQRLSPGRPVKPLSVLSGLLCLPTEHEAYASGTKLLTATSAQP